MQNTRIKSIDAINYTNRGRNRRVIHAWYGNLSSKHRAINKTIRSTVHPEVQISAGDWTPTSFSGVLLFIALLWSLSTPLSIVIRWSCEYQYQNWPHYWSTQAHFSRFKRCCHWLLRNLRSLRSLHQKSLDQKAASLKTRIRTRKSTVTHWWYSQVWFQ